jgi:hypothetical protein
MLRSHILWIRCSHWVCAYMQIGTSSDGHSCNTVHFNMNCTADLSTLKPLRFIAPCCMLAGMVTASLVFAPS